MSEVERRENADLRGELSALIVSNWEIGNKLGRILDWIQMTSYHISSGKRSHNRFGVPVIAQPE